MVKPEKNARALLERLMDDEFRAKLEANPVAVLAEFGFVIDPKIAPYAVSLPSKEHIKENFDLLSKQIEASSTWILFCR